MDVMNLIRGGSGSRRVVGRGKEGSYIHTYVLAAECSQPCDSKPVQGLSPCEK